MNVNADSFLRFAEKCGRMPVTISEVQKTGLGAAALVTKKSILEAASARGWPVAGKRKVSVSYKVLPGVAEVRGTGFAAMFQKGAKPHREPKARGRKSKNKINIPGVGVFDHVSHPGFKGRGFWNEGVAAAAPLVTKEFEKGLGLGLRKVFS